MDDNVNIGVLGAGFMGGMHGSRLLKLPGVTLRAICDSRRLAARSLAEKLGVPHHYTSFDRMLAEQKLDALYICLPPFAHRGQTEKAAEKGIHLFLEKPIALTLKQAEKICAAVEKAGVVSQVGFHLRFRRGVMLLKQMLVDGAAGKPSLFTGRYWCNFGGADWWRNVRTSGGQVYEQVIHIYDLALHLFGEAAAAAGFLENLCHRESPGYTVEDASVSAIRFRNGSLASITGSNCALPEHFIGDFRVVCEKALLDFRSSGDWRIKDESTLYTHDGAGNLQRQDFVEDGDVYALESEDFLQAIRTGGTTRTPVRAGLESIRLVSAVIASAARGGKPIQL